jgi:hypothetical protein
MKAMEIFTRQFFVNNKTRMAPLAKKIQWFGRKGFIDLGCNVTAEICVMERGYSDHFVVLNVAIVHKLNGKITSLDFPFADMDPRNCTPASAQHPNVAGVGNYYAWRSGGSLDWYIRVPRAEETQQLGDRVLEFITLYTPEGA